MRGYSARLVLALVAAALVAGVGGAQGRTVQTTTTVRMQVLGLGTIKDDKNQLRCGNGSTTCRVSYSGSGTVAFTPTDSVLGWTFSSWEGGCSDPCTITLAPSDTDIEVTATFDPSQVVGTKTLSVTTNGDSQGDGGGVEGGDIDCVTGDPSDCSWDVTTGSTTTIVEIPDDGFVFGGWGGACSGTQRGCTLTMSADRNVTATFKKPVLTVIVKGNGTVTDGNIVCTSAGGAGCSAAEDAGTDVTLTATPDSGGSFTGWSGACSGREQCTVSMTGDRSVTATFSGAGGGGPSTVPLTVSITGSGTVTGGAISCGGGSVVCSANVAVGATVTLTATAASGSSFKSWGGACSGSARTCTLTMSAKRDVTATFVADGTSGGPTTTLTLQVAGRGTVSATGGTCASGGPVKSCPQQYEVGTSVDLTAAPASGAKFLRWGGACTGSSRTCTVKLDAAKTVTATFSGASPATTRTILFSRGRPTVGRTRAGYTVTLRFTTNQRGTARIKALRAGRLGTALAFPVAGGTAKVGPFPLLQSGFYAIDLTLGGGALHWGVCLGRCGERASSTPFTLTRQPSTAARTGAAWSLTLQFRSTAQAGMQLSVYRRSKLAREVQFPARAGSITIGPLLLSPGTYTFKLEATDAVGRMRTLNWFAVLPG